MWAVGEWRPQIALDGPGAGRGKTQGSESTLGVEIVRGLTHSQGAPRGWAWGEGTGHYTAKEVGGYTWGTQSSPQGSRP